MIGEAVVHELDVFSSNSYQLAVERYEDMIYSPINTVDINGFVEFFIHGYPTAMKALNSIYLLATVQLVEADGKLITAAAENAPWLVNGTLMSLFKSGSMYLNNVQIANISDNFGQQEFISMSLNYSSHVASSKLANQGFFPNTEEQKLKDLFKASKQVELMGKINLGNCDKLVIPSVSIGIKLGFQSPDYYIIESASAKVHAKVILNDIKLVVRHFIIRDPYLLHMEQMLSKGHPAIYEYSYVQTIATTLAANQSSVSLNSVYQGLRPSFLLLAFVDNETYCGTRTTDPMKYKHNNLKSACFIVNNETFPKTPYEMSFSDTEDKTARVFNALNSSLSIANENISTMVDKESFISNSFFIASDISNFSSALTSLSDPLENATIGFNLTFSKPPKKPLTALLFMLLPRKIEISAARNVNLVY